MCVCVRARAFFFYPVSIVDTPRSDTVNAFNVFSIVQLGLHWSASALFTLYSALQNDFGHGHANKRTKQQHEQYRIRRITVYPRYAAKSLNSKFALVNTRSFKKNILYQRLRCC